MNMLPAKRYPERLESLYESGLGAAEKLVQWVKSTGIGRWWDRTCKKIKEGIDPDPLSRSNTSKMLVGIEILESLLKIICNRNHPDERRAHFLRREYLIEANSGWLQKGLIAGSSGDPMDILPFHVNVPENFTNADFLYYLYRDGISNKAWVSPALSLFYHSRVRK